MADEKNGKYSSEEMERYFNDPEYRKQKQKGITWLKNRRNQYLVGGGVLLMLMVIYTFYLV